jgi:hypothetical protein
MALTLMNQNWMDRLFLRGYAKRLKLEIERRLPGRSPDLYAAIEVQAQELIDANRGMVVDKASASHLFLTCVLLASYRVLSEAIQDEAIAQEMLRGPFLDTGKKGSEGMMSLMPLVTRDPFRFMVTISKSKQEAYYGKAFERDLVQDDDAVYSMVIRKCFYHSFFIANGAPELMPLFCQKDNNWSDAINPSKLGFRFDRPETLGEGGSQCVFRFSRVGEMTELPVVSVS